MPLAKIKLALAKLTTQALHDAAQRAATALTTNAATFPGPPVAAAALGTAAADALVTWSQATQAHKDAAALMTQAHQKLRDLRTSVTQDAHYVAAVAKGDPVLITRGGFDVAAPAAPVGIVAAPKALALTEGDHVGQLDAHWDPEKGVTVYGVEVNFTDATKEADWQLWCIAHGSKVLIDKLPSGKLVSVRVFADTSAGDGPRTSPVARVAP